MAHKDCKRQEIYVRKDAFRLWCSQHHKNPMRQLTDLARIGLITDLEHKFVLGQGTKYASSKAVCFTVDLTHPEYAQLKGVGQ